MTDFDGHFLFEPLPILYHCPFRFPGLDFAGNMTLRYVIGKIEIKIMYAFLFIARLTLLYHNVLVIYMVGLKFRYMWPRVLY